METATGDELFDMAEKFFKEKKFQEALKAFRLFQTEYGSAPEAVVANFNTLYPIAICHVYISDFPGAVAAINEALTKEPPDPKTKLTPEQIQELTFWLGICELQLKNYAQARETLEKFIALFPPGSEKKPNYIRKNPVAARIGEARSVIGTTYIIEGKFREAADYFAKLKPSLSPDARGRAVIFELYALEQLSDYDTVRSIIPANISLSKDAGDLTIYQLATNTGGLPRQHNNFMQLRYFISFLFTGRNLYGCVNKKSIYRYLRKYKRPRKTKHNYVYSNLGNGLLTHLIEIKTGHPISKLLQEKIFRPIGLRDTILHLNAEQRSRLATGHPGDQPIFKSRRTPMEPWDMGEILGASCGLHSTANDLLLFARANMGPKSHPMGKDLLSLQHPQVKASDQEHGIGWTIERIQRGREVLIFKHGMVSGYSAYIGINVEHQIAVVVLCNNFIWHEKVGHNLLLRMLEFHAAKHSVENVYSKSILKQ